MGKNKITTEIFIERALNVHNGLYSYEEAVYKGAKEKITITCGIHGNFYQNYSNHLKGQGCSKCFFESKKFTTEVFIEKAKQQHGDKYDYSNTEYKGAHEKVTVECRTHSVFTQFAYDHLRGQGCPACGLISMRDTTEEFVEKAKKVHGDFYSYEDTIYTKASEKVIINCPKHGPYLQQAASHIVGKNCPSCSSENAWDTRQSFIEKAKKVHGNKYDYSDVDYKGSNEKITLYCSHHGSFLQTPKGHLSGKGCSKCGHESHWQRSKYIKKANGRICTFYTLRCFNEDEEFYKIGITMNSVKERYAHSESMPYNYEIISEIFGEAGFIWDLEIVEKRKLKEFNYQPKIKFGGSKRECFTKYKLDETE